ncbi:hypothetical protein I4U23_006664 [Adineta vaga]|nr:hypothetical protein I4U23_006664 [Adineta vaga]
MSSKSTNPTNNTNISSDNPNQKSAPYAVNNRLSSPHHVRHHSYDTTSNTLAAQIFPPSRSNRKENSTNDNTHSRFLPAHQSTFTNLNSNHYHQHNYSASQENLRHSDVNPSTFTSVSLKHPIPPNCSSTASIASIPPGTTTITTVPPNSLPSSLSHSNNHSSFSSSNSSTILNHFNIHNAKLIALLLFFALLFYHGSLRYIKGATSCHRLLNEGRIERYHVWQPTGCMIHWYDLLDYNQCTRLITQSSSTVDKSLLATRKAFNNRIDPGEWLRTRKQEQQRLKQEKQDKTKIDFSYTFIGDERLYMIYRTFINTIKYHSNLSRKKPSTINKEKDHKQQHKQYPFVYKHEKNLTYTNENFILQYYSVQTFNDYLYNLLYSWTTNTSIRPHVLIIGLGLYDGLRENASLDTMKYFEGNLTRIKQNLLTNISLTTTIFWFGQPHLALNEHLFQFSHNSLQQQQIEYINEFIPKLNSYIDRMNSIAKHVFYHTNIYWHSSTLLEEYSTISNENAFLYDDNNDEYFVTYDREDYDDDNNNNVESTHNLEQNDLTQSSSSSSSSSSTTTILPNLLSLLYLDFDDSSSNQTEIIYYSYMPLRKNHTALSTSLINSGKIYEFYKLSSFTRHTCVQILLNALCNPLLLPDDGTCCAQVPPLTRLQFLLSLILGCSITFFIIYIVYRVRYVFILKRKSHINLNYGKQIHHDEQHIQHQENNSIPNGHCHMNGAFTKDVNEDGEEADQQLLTPTMNGDCSSNYSRSNSSNPASNQNPPLLSTGLSRYRFLIPKFLRNLRKKSREHLLPPLLLTTSIATQSSSSSSSNGNHNNNSSYPSRFYRKKNSLFYFPLSDLNILRTSVKYAFILLYFYLADRTDFLMKENSHFSRIAFFLPLTYIGILGIFFHDKYFQKTTSNRSSPNQHSIPPSPNSPSTSIFSPVHNNDYEQIQSHSDSNDENISMPNNGTNNNNNNSFLNKEQINEMRGWMMVILLAYQMTDASGKSLVLSMSIQLLISAYLFLSAYSHFHYYWTTGNYQFLPFIQMLFKYNFLTITLCLLMNRHYQSYYYPPLISFYFSVMYVILACIPPRISAASVKEKPIHFVYLLLKFLLMGM